MVGDVGEHYPKERNATEEVLFRAAGLTTANRVREVSFDVRRGEVFGLGGVLGSGRTEVARAIFGVDRLTGGRHAALAASPLRPRARPTPSAPALRWCPRTGRRTGSSSTSRASPTSPSPACDKLGRHGTIRLRTEREVGTAAGRGELDITPAAEQRLVGMLSGGNQQKIVIARWLFADAELFILDEPTQGIDIGAKIAVYRLINRLTAAGKGVILISSDHDELLAMSDRIGIMSHGRLVGVHQPPGARHHLAGPSLGRHRRREGGRRMKRFLATPLAGPLIALVVVATAVALTTDRFLEAGNLSNLVLQVSIIAIVAIGSTIVIFTGGIDLSPGSMIALLTMVFAMTVKMGRCPLALASPGRARARRGCWGWSTALLTAYLRIPSFITTLAALSAFRGVAFMFNNGSPIFSLSPHLERIFYGNAARRTAAALLRGGAVRGRLLVPALHRPRAGHLCGGRQPGRRPAVGHQRAPHPAPRLPHRRLIGRRRRGADGGAAQLRLAQLRRRAWSCRPSPRR